MAPDLDFVIWFASPQRYLVDHRGISHSLILLPLWAALLAWVFRSLYRGRYRWGAFFPVVAMALGVHIGADVLTAFGTELFAPLSSIRISIPTTFVLDLGFTGIIVLGLLASAVRPEARAPAVAAVLALLAYVGFEGGLHEDAVRWGASYARAREWEPAEVLAIPEPLSPFNWLVIIDRGYDYHVAYVGLNRTQVRHVAPGASWLTRLAAAYRPPEHPDWQKVPRYSGVSADRAFERRAWRARVFRPYRDFSLLPVAQWPETGAAGRCVGFSDLRFRLPQAALGRLAYGLCRQAGQWYIPRTWPPREPPRARAAG